MTAYDAHNNIQAFSVYRLDSFKIGTGAYYNYGFSGGDELKAIPNKGTKGVDGFIGLNILEQGVWSFNNMTGKVIVATTIDSIPAARKLYRIPLKKRYDRWFVSVSIDGIKTEAILDLGYNGSLMLPKKMIAKVKPKHLLTYYGLTNHTLGGANYDTLKYYHDARLKLGDAGPELENKMTCFSNSELTLLGAGLLSQHYLTLDLAHNAMYLAPLLPGIHNKNRMKTWGLNINKQGEDWTVTTLLKGSDAEKKGICIGDKLLSINNKKPVPDDDRLSYKLIDEALGSDDTLNLELLRNGTPVKVVLGDKVEY